MRELRGKKFPAFNTHGRLKVGRHAHAELQGLGWDVEDSSDVCPTLHQRLWNDLKHPNPTVNNTTHSKVRIELARSYDAISHANGHEPLELQLRALPDNVAAELRRIPR